MRKVNLDICITPQALVSAALFLLILPLDWLAAWFIAAALHEVFHILAVLLCGKHINRLVINANGAQIQAEPLTYGQTLLCAFSGPIGGLFLLLFTRRYPQLTFCGFAQSFFNLIPVYPLDGGRVLESFLKLMFHDKLADRLSEVISLVVICTLVIVSLLGAIKLQTCLPMLIPFLIILKYREYKISLQNNASSSTIVLPN